MTTREIRTRKRTPKPDNVAAEHGEISCNALHDNIRLAVRYVAPSQLKLPKRKLRKHSKRQLKLIEASVLAHGFLDPLLVNSDNEIVCGYGRWLVANDLKLALVPVIALDHLSPAQLRLYAIAENRLGELSEFDLGELKLELIELGTLDCDLNLEITGFSTSEIDDLVCGKDPEAAETGEPKCEVEAISRPGDLWQLGVHRLYCGNALEAESFAVLMAGEKAGMVFADPPYNRPAKSISGMGRHQHADFAMAAGEMSRAEFTSFLATSFGHLAHNSVNGSIHFQCMDWKHQGEMLAAGEQVYSELKNLVVWVKPAAGMGSFYRSQHELVYAWKHGTAPHVNNFGLGDTGRFRSNVWSYEGNSGFHRDRDDELAAHPTVKPTTLVADAIRDCAKRGAIVLDPFGGYGTTMIAAERTGRRARLIELYPLYCDASIRRWEKLTGEKAILVATGQTLTEVAAARGVMVLADADDAEADIGPDEVTGDNDDGADLVGEVL